MKPLERNKEKLESCDQQVIIDRKRMEERVQDLDGELLQL